MALHLTHKLLATVMAMAFMSGIAAHAAEAPQRPIIPASLPAASSLPSTIQTAASRLTEQATGTVDPMGAIRDAYQRDHVALERLRQQASQLQGSAHPAFNQYIDDQESALAETERTALATTRPSLDGTINAMDALVAAAQSKLDQELQSAGKSNGSKGQGTSGQNGKSGQSARSGESTKRIR